MLEIQGFYGSKESVGGRFSNSGTGSNIKLTLLDSCGIVKVEDETIPGIPFNFVPLSDIQQRAVDELVGKKQWCKVTRFFAFIVNIKQLYEI